MDQREELAALRRMAELEEKARAGSVSQPEQLIDPTAGMSTLQLYGAGAGQGLVSLARGARQQLLDRPAAAIESMIPGGESISRFFGGKTAKEIAAENQAKIDEAAKLDQPLLNRGPALGASIAAQGLGLAPAMATTPAISPGMLAAITGGIGGTMQPTTSEQGLTGVAKNAAIGAAAGKAGDAIGRGVARVVQPAVDPAVKLLRSMGVNMTVGQRLGGVANAVEQRLAGQLPGITGARNASFADAERGLAQKALSVVDETLPKGTAAGKDVVKETGAILSGRYDALMQKMPLRADQQFNAEISALQNLAQTGAMPKANSKQLNNLVRTEVLDKFQGQGVMTGQTLKEVQTSLRVQADRYGKSLDPNQNNMSDALKEVQAALRRLAERNHPQHAQELKSLDTAWAQFARVRDASVRSGVADEPFSPARYAQAVKAADQSKGKWKTAQGDAYMQDEADAMLRILGNRVPDSGTAGRLAQGAQGAAYFTNPALLAIPATSAAAYTGPVQRGLVSALTDRPEVAQLTAEQIRALAPYMGLIGASSATNPGLLR
jgi:hypothetical protein